MAFYIKWFTQITITLYPGISLKLSIWSRLMKGLWCRCDLCKKMDVLALGFMVSMVMGVCRSINTKATIVLILVENQTGSKPRWKRHIAGSSGPLWCHMTTTDTPPLPLSPHFKNRKDTHKRITILLLIYFFVFIHKCHALKFLVLSDEAVSKRDFEWTLCFVLFFCKGDVTHCINLRSLSHFLIVPSQPKDTTTKITRYSVIDCVFFPCSLYLLFK